MMETKRTPAALILAAALMSVAGCTVNPVTGETDLAPTMSLSQEQSIGDKSHPNIVKQFGGEISDRRVAAYVSDVGQRVARHSDYGGKRFKFTVLNSPVSNAFAVPGGYIYVTRGLLAVANSEAELAGVLGHEIGHITARHSARRQTSALLGGIATIGAAVLGGSEAARAVQMVAGGTSANYSRGQELESDTLGVRYITKAGYDPYEQADFLSHLQAQAELSARLAGKNNYDPNRVDFFASHPATAQRVVQAINQAKASGVAVNGGVQRDTEYLQNINGILYGDDPEQGYVKGRRFQHPKLRFGFEVPRGYRLQNTSKAVGAVGPNGARMNFSGGKYTGRSMPEYLARVWAPQIKLARLNDVEAVTINGMPGATGWTRANSNKGSLYVRMVAVRFDNDQVYRFLMTTPANQGNAREADFRQIATSLRRLSGSEAAGLRPQRLKTMRVRRGQTVARLARKMPFEDFREQRFRVLNGLKPGEEVRSGQYVKVVTE